MNEWIHDWSEVDGDGTYLVRSINARDDKSLYLGSVEQPIYSGWQVRRLREGCYVALLLPAFDSSKVKWANKK